MRLPRAAVLALASGLSAVLPACAVDPPTAPAMERLRVSAAGDALVLAASGRPFRVHGFNYDHDAGGALIESYWEEDWERVAGDFAEMRALGANTVRIHLQVAAFLDAPDRVSPGALARLGELLRLAERTGLYLDLTGLGCYHADEVPAWYDALDEAARWDAQAVFWGAIAEVCAGSPAMLCYDLMNEPILPGAGETADGWLAGAFAGKHFVQRISLDLRGRTREQVAEAWVGKLAAAIRAHDPDALVTVGVIPWGMTFRGARPLFYADGPRAHLDLAAVHVYPRTGEAALAAEVLREFDLGLPVIVEETFPLHGSLDDLDALLVATDDFRDGLIGFYWGQTRAELARPGATFSEALTRAWLDWFSARAPEPDASAW